MAGKIRFSFQMRVFLTVLTLCWLLVGVFMVLQYHREKEFKASLLDARLQMHNDRIIEDIRQGQHIEDIVARIGTPVKDLRVTLIDRGGNVLSAFRKSTRECVYGAAERTTMPSSPSRAE